jgi:hypothetical protein
MRETSSLLKGVHEYSLVKRLTTQPKRMKEAYECKLDQGQALTLLAVLMDEWPRYVLPHLTLSSKPLKVYWNHKDGRARGGYFPSKDGTMRPFLKLPIKGLTAGLVLHEYCHVVTIYMEKNSRNEKKNRRHSPHGEHFRTVFDLMLGLHKEDWINISKL